jgi:hypothetical protein
MSFLFIVFPCRISKIQSLKTKQIYYIYIFANLGTFTTLKRRENHAIERPDRRELGDLVEPPEKHEICGTKMATVGLFQPELSDLAWRLTVT